MRSEMISRREGMVRSQVEELSSGICSKILNIPAVKDSESIGIYISLKNEVLAEKLLMPLSDEGKKVFVPVVSDKKILRFGHLTSLEDTCKGAYGTEEPKTKIFALKGSIGVFVIPGLAFDLNLSRVGWGKGYYDLFLSENNGVKIGAAYDFQIVEKIQDELHDIRMDFVITERRILKS